MTGIKGKAHNYGIVISNLRDLDSAGKNKIIFIYIYWILLLQGDLQ